MSNLQEFQENRLAAFKAVSGFDGQIRQESGNRPAYYQIGQVVHFSITNLTESIPAIIHARHENRKGYRYDLIIHYPVYELGSTVDGPSTTWHEKRLYSVDESFLEGMVSTNEGADVVTECTDGTIIQFLLGTHSFKGKWFGDNVGGVNYWWREELRKNNSVSLANFPEDLHAAAEPLRVYLAKNRALDSIAIVSATSADIYSFNMHVS